MPRKESQLLDNHSQVVAALVVVIGFNTYISKVEPICRSVVFPGIDGEQIWLAMAEHQRSVCANTVLLPVDSCMLHVSCT